jgi:hypothetical protein
MPLDATYPIILALCAMVARHGDRTPSFNMHAKVAGDLPFREGFLSPADNEAGIFQCL